MDTEFTKKLSIQWPIIQAPMADAATVELAAAVSNAGALGSIACAYMTPQEIHTHIRKIRDLTDKPFNVNLFIPEKYNVSKEKIDAVNHVMQGYRDELGISSPPLPGKYEIPFNEQIDVILQEKVPVFSFTFGSLDGKYVDRLREQNTLMMGTATTVEEGLCLEKDGVDMVISQGFEAGGHRGSFLKRPKDSLIGSMALIPTLSDRISIPVIASGGIMDRRGIAAALILGASAVQMGTAFLTCHEAGIPDSHKNAILKAHDDSTSLTRAFSGKAARGIKNRFMEEMDGVDELIPDFPVQNVLTQDIRKKARDKDVNDLMSLWCGQGGGHLSKKTSAATLVESLIKDLKTFERFY